MNPNPIEFLSFPYLSLSVGLALFIWALAERDRRGSWLRIVVPWPHTRPWESADRSSLGLPAETTAALLGYTLLFIAGWTSGYLLRRSGATDAVATLVVVVFAFIYARWAIGWNLFVALGVLWREIAYRFDNPIAKAARQRRWQKRLDHERREANRERQRQAACAHEWRTQLFTEGSITTCRRCGANRDRLGT